MLGLVAEEIHAQEGADAAAGDGQPDEGVFGDAPLPFPGLPFVNAVDEEGQDVYADEVDDKVTHGRPIRPINQNLLIFFSRHFRTYR